MNFDNSPRQIFLSHVSDDKGYAVKFRTLLEPLGYSAFTCFDIPSDQGPDIADKVESVLTHCSLVVVLVGPKTRLSRWVDMEIDLGLSPRIGQPAAGLLGIILPEHEDFSKPYYEPESVPARLHDRVRWEYALLRKWTDNTQAIREWLQDAEKRRRHFRPTVNYKVQLALRSHPWDESADMPRPFLQSLLERE